MLTMLLNHTNTITYPLQQLIEKPGSIPYTQQVTYAHLNELKHVIDQLVTAAPIVTPQSIDLLRHRLCKVYHREALLFHLGDCAESFAQAHLASTLKKQRYFSAPQTQLQTKTQKPSVLIARMAGQYMKPRSKSFELLYGQRLPV